MSKIALITGVSSRIGIGRAAAQLFHENNYRIIGVDSEPSNKDDFDFPVEFYRVDLSKTCEIESFCKELSGKYEQIDVLVNNAGVHGYKSAEDMTIEEFDKITAVNFRAPWLLMKLLRPLLARGGGSAVVNISSVNADRTTKYRSVYAGTKAAVKVMSKSLAAELGEDNIRVNCVQPGSTHTAMMLDYLVREDPEYGAGLTVEEKLKKVDAETGILHRMGSPRDIAECILFLADNKRSSFITGASLLADGGSLAVCSTDL